MDSDSQPISPAQSSTSLLMETECFICRDVELQASDPLRKFCDCKNLLAHHVCLSTWIQRGRGSEDRLRCIVCRATYQLQKRSPWRVLCLQWEPWVVLITVFVLMGLVSYMVHCLIMLIDNPPPPRVFKLASVSFGLLAEILLLKCLSSYFCSRYKAATQNSITVRARGVEENGTGPGGWNHPTLSCDASLVDVNQRKADV
ncbi:uncharacterized protein [Takifugu rubripes]|uniref:uncharacterized protein n=1 Tax=Takifugu rubripes TaxID=31033 RepID=UPI0005D2B5C8|nr:uncharacterized protein LOC105417892 [Takifugu rubripes]|eukprot:XP_011612755.1 PREDICTED: uncharacterized protein LOC105417892 [Takifugu rubripes]